MKDNLYKINGILSNRSEVVYVSSANQFTLTY